MSASSRIWYRVSGRRLVTHPVAVLCVVMPVRVQTTRDAQTGAMFCRLISSNGFILLITHRANEV